jgi:hypothetical protein
LLRRTLNEPVALDRQVRRMLRHPKAEGTRDNFAASGSTCAALDVTTPLPLLYPDFDDPLRQAMRTEVELLFDTIVRDDRNIVELLDADYTFVNERWPSTTGSKNITGSSSASVTLGPTWRSARACSGKGLPCYQLQAGSHVTGYAGKWIMTNMLGMSPPNPAARRAALPPRAADPTRKNRRCARRWKTIACVRTACSAID